jgi:Resolvase, N terminal domain
MMLSLALREHQPQRIPPFGWAARLGPSPMRDEQGHVSDDGVFAEFERAMIQERVRAGLARAKHEGKALGRPKDGATETAVRKALRKGDKGMRKIAAELGVGVGTVQRVKAALAPEARSAPAQRSPADNRWLVRWRLTALPPPVRRSEPDNEVGRH